MKICGVRGVGQYKTESWHLADGCLQQARGAMSVFLASLGDKTDRTCYLRVNKPFFC